MNDLNEETIEFLSNSGWTPTRKIDVTSYLQAHEDAGCVVPEIVVEFMSNFGELKIDLPIDTTIENNSKKKPPSGKVHFDGLISGDFCGDLKHYVENVNVKALYPIGELGGQSMLLLDEYGRMYYELGLSEIYQFSETVAEGLNKIIASRGNVR
ncbi:MAG: hypothetical protein Phog2KO_28640 [Phototrophicaceae bacterium]